VDPLEKGKIAKIGPVPDRGPDEPDREAREPFCDPPGLSGPVSDVLKKIRTERKRPLLALLSHFIDDELMDQVYGFKQELRAAAITNQSGGADVDVLIHSPGGDLNSCFRVARLLCSCVNSWEALVPGIATSGATLICLGSSNIVLSHQGILGPLDPQVISKHRERVFAVERQSPLEAFEALRVLREFSLTSLDSAMEFLLERGVAPHLALETACTLAIRMVEPIAGKIEPYDLGAFALDSKVALEYCRSVANGRDSAKKSQRTVDPQKLVEGYPHHEFAIDLEEARALNFVVSEPTPAIEALFDEVRPHVEEVHRYVGFVP
jgi:serine dehydrogenase proteinase